MDDVCGMPLSYPVKQFSAIQDPHPCGCLAVEWAFPNLETLPGPGKILKNEKYPASSGILSVLTVSNKNYEN
jgi:hypothetical protein